MTKEFKLFKPTDVHNYYGYDLAKEKSKVSLVRRICTIVRRAPEYDVWAKAKKVGYEKCPICGRDYLSARPEVHHDPTLFEVVYNYIETLIESEEILSKSPIEIAKDILEDHLNDKVSCVTICELCHKEIHNLRKAEGLGADE